MNKGITVALAGNPNSGKTTLFNRLTGMRQHVGNYPGVTVEKKEGSVTFRGYNIQVVDLPGIYGLTAYSLDELVTRNFLIEEKPDVVVSVVDASNLERSLYLATQLMELSSHVIVALNMADTAAELGFHIDQALLSKLFGVPIVFTVATKNEGIEKLLEEAVNLFEEKDRSESAVIRYGEEIEHELDMLQALLSRDPTLATKYPPRWLALKMLEDDRELVSKVEKTPHAETIIRQAQKSRHHLHTIFGDTSDVLIAERRYGFISGACSEAVKRSYEIRHSVSDKIDSILLSRALGLPVFLMVMWALFRFTFTLSEPIVGWLEAGQGFLADAAGKFLPYHYGICSFVTEGVIGGVGSVLVFIPVVSLLFLALAFLEDSGYMARGAFIMDRFMHAMGLHGRSFVPMILGFGCNVPAIMAARTIESKKDRLTTILIIPFMSCAARLPVYGLFIGAFFPERIGGNVLFSLYLLGIAVGVVSSRVFRKHLFPGEGVPFVMELPPYRMPTAAGLLIHMWGRVVLYVKKAGTVILAGTLVVWFLSNFPRTAQYPNKYNAFAEGTPHGQEMAVDLQQRMELEKMEQSYAGKIGKTIAPVLRPLGFDDWRVAVGLTGGIVAKEIIVGILGTLYEAGKTDRSGKNPLALRDALQGQVRADGSKMYSPLAAYSLMVFVLLYAPCLATIAVIRKETGTWRWPLFSIFYTTSMAWVAAFVVYQGGRLLEIGG